MFHFVRSSVRSLALCLLLLLAVTAPAAAILPPFDFVPGLTQPMALGPGEIQSQSFFILRNHETCAVCQVNPPPGATCCTSSIFVSLLDLPAGVSGCISTPAGCLSTPVAGDFPLAVLSAGSNVVPGNYTVHVKAQAFDGPNPRIQIESVPVHLFPFSAQFPLATQLLQGAAVTIPVSIVRAQGFTAPIAAQVVGAGAQDVAVQLGFDADGDLSEVLLDVDSDATPGLRAVAVQLTSGTESRTIDVPFDIKAAFDFSVSPTTALIVAGGSQGFTATFDRGPGFGGSITLSLLGAPTGLTGSFNSHGTFGSSAAFTLSTTSHVATGTYYVTVRANGGGLVRDAVLRILVQRAGIVLP